MASVLLYQGEKQESYFKDIIQYSFKERPRKWRRGFKLGGIQCIPDAAASNRMQKCRSRISEFIASCRYLPGPAKMVFLLPLFLWEKRIRPINIPISTAMLLGAEKDAFALLFSLAGDTCCPDIAAASLATTPVGLLVYCCSNSNLHFLRPLDRFFLRGMGICVVIQLPIKMM